MNAPQATLLVMLVCSTLILMLAIGIAHVLEQHFSGDDEPEFEPELTPLAPGQQVLMLPKGADIKTVMTEPVSSLHGVPIERPGVTAGSLWGRNHV